MNNQELYKIVSNLSPVSTIVFDMESVVHGNIVKRVEGIVAELTSTSSYKKRVEEKTGVEYTPAKRVWGVRMPNLPLVEHKDSYYMECYVKQSGTTTYWINNGQLFEKEGILYTAGGIEVFKLPKKQVFKEDHIDIRCIKAENIKSINVILLED